MNRFINRFHCSWAVLALAVANAGAQSYDLARDFSGASNPNGVWSYGSKTSIAGALTLLSFARAGTPESWEFQAGVWPAIYHNNSANVIPTDGGQGAYAPGSVWLAAGENGTTKNFGVIRFTIPGGTGWTYRIESRVRSGLVGPVSSDADFHVARNGTELFGTNRPASSTTWVGYSNVLALSAGDTIDLLVGRGSDGSQPGSVLILDAWITLVSTNTPPPLATYDASRDFSKTANPNGVWSYGWQEAFGGAFNLLTVSGSVPYDNGVPVDYWRFSSPSDPVVFHNASTNTAISNGGQGVHPPGALFFFAGPAGTVRNFGVIRFTAPVNADYRLDTAVKPFLNGPPQGDTDFHVVRNGVQVFGTNLAVSASTAFSGTFALGAGDTVDLAVGRGADNSNFGSGLDITARITVVSTNVPTPPPSRLLVVNAMAPPASVASVPIQVVARGDENAFSFSLDFIPSLLSFRSAALSGFPGATLIVNSNNAGAGHLGFVLALPASTALAAVTQELVRVEFQTGLTSGTGAVAFGNSPVSLQVADALARPVPAMYSPGNVRVTSAGFEADVAPRPAGDGAIEVIDLVQVGRFAANLDVPASGEFWLVDCAPRATGGNGLISTADFVQAGRYVAALDPPTPAGGPTAPVGGFVGFQPAAYSPRKVSVTGRAAAPSAVFTLPVLLEAQGDENALGLSIVFDPAKMTFAGAASGVDAASASLTVNASGKDSGKLGFVLALSAGQTFSAGTKEALRLSFVAAGNAAGSGAVSFGDEPVLRELVDAAAESQAATFVGGTVTFGVGTPPGPLLSFTRSDSTLLLAWPVSAEAFELEGTTGTLLTPWAPISSFTFGEQKMAVVPISSGQRYFRLKKP